MTSERDDCRRAAAECLELARLTKNTEAKRVMLSMALKWTKAAYSHDRLSSLMCSRSTIGGNSDR
jgi:hypothetical protein